jgi:hypothetical protein
MLEIVISLMVGFALGYGVRDWASRQDRLQHRRTVLIAQLEALARAADVVGKERE